MVILKDYQFKHVNGNAIGIRSLSRRLLSACITLARGAFLDLYVA